MKFNSLKKLLLEFDYEKIWIKPDGQLLRSWALSHSELAADEIKKKSLLAFTDALKKGWIRIINSSKMIDFQFVKDEVSPKAKKALIDYIFKNKNSKFQIESMKWPENFAPHVVLKEFNNAEEILDWIDLNL